MHISSLGLVSAAEFTGVAFAGSQGSVAGAEANAGIATRKRKRSSVCAASSGAARKGRILFTDMIMPV